MSAAECFEVRGVGDIVAVRPLAEYPSARGRSQIEIVECAELVEAADPPRLAAMVIAVLQDGMLVARIRGDVTALHDAMSTALNARG